MVLSGPVVTISKNESLLREWGQKWIRSHVEESVESQPAGLRRRRASQTLNTNISMFRS